MAKSYRITGRLRDERSQTVDGYTVQAFDKDLGVYGHPDDRLGKDKTKEDGDFSIEFTEATFKDWFEDSPKIYLQIRDTEGRVVISTAGKDNTSGAVDFQVKLGKSQPNPLEPDLYANGLERMRTGLQNVGDAVDLSRADVKDLFQLFLGVIGAWTSFRDEIVRICGYDSIQVPKQPRKEEHYHVTRWDEAVLPT